MSLTGASRGRARAARGALVLLVAVALSGLSPAPISADRPVAAARVFGTPFHPTTGSVARVTRLVVDLLRPAALTVRVRDFRGYLVRTLAEASPSGAGQRRFEWDGRNATGTEVANGGYRFELETNEAGTISRQELLTTKARYGVYRPAPGAVLVAIDAGHGAPDSGATYGGRREADFNLDIARRVQTMLLGAKADVLMVRDADQWLNVPALELTGDGRIDRTDDLQARLDLVNPQRPDLMTVVMNNAYGCHCAHGTETFTHPGRTWTPEALVLGRLIQEEHMAVLQQYRTATWAPYDRGARTLDRYHETRPYLPVGRPRPSSFVTVLVESLFMDQPPELGLLKLARVRQSIAEAYYDAIARYLAQRQYGLRYDVVSAPTVAAPGERVTLQLTVTNRGNATADGWKVRVGAVPAPTPVAGASLPVLPYDGSPSRGTQLTRVLLPTLAPGASATVSASVLAPATAGSWILKIDGALPDGRWLSDRGVSQLQLPLLIQDGGASVTPPPTSGATRSASQPASAPPEGAESPAEATHDPRTTGIDDLSPGLDPGGFAVPGVTGEPLFCPIYDE